MSDSNGTPPSPTVYSCTDSGNAEIFASLYKGKVLFDHLRGKWMIWTGVRWREDDNGLIFRLATEVPKRRRALSGTIENDDVRGKQYGFSLTSENAARIDAMFKIARNHAALTDSGKNWDENPWLICCENGPLDLQTGRLIKPSPQQRISKSTGVMYDPAAECPLWLDTLNKMWPDQPDVLDYVQRVFGYAITGSIREQALFCFYGGGSNGKNTTLDTAVAAMGEYGYTMPFATLESDARSAVSNDLAALQGRRFVMASETKEDTRLNEGRIKSLTGDSKITARFLYKEPFTFAVSSKFFLAFNHKPKIYDDSEGMWRRVKMIEVPGVFIPGTVIKGFGDLLLAELPGIFTWMVRGCLAWQERGLAAPESVKADTDAYRQESNPISPFLEENCIEGDGLMIVSTDLWTTYQQWSKNEGEKYPLSRNGFGRRMSGKGFTNPLVKIGGKPVRVWKGLTTIEGVNQPRLIPDEDTTVQ